MSKHPAADYVAPQERLSEDTATAPSHGDIAVLAHEMWIARGRGHGAAEEDWFEAERRLGAGNGHDRSA